VSPQMLSSNYNHPGADSAHYKGITFMQENWDEGQTQRNATFNSSGVNIMNF
jgi:hypothetical protein